MKPERTYIWLCTCGERGGVDIEWDENRYPCGKCYARLRQELNERCRNETMADKR